GNAEVAKRDLFFSAAGRSLLETLPSLSVQDLHTNFKTALAVTDAVLGIVNRPTTSAKAERTFDLFLDLADELAEAVVGEMRLRIPVDGDEVVCRAEPLFHAALRAERWTELDEVATQTASYFSGDLPASEVA